MKHISEKKRLFWIGLVVCLVGGSLVWVGDGAESLSRKSVVASGLILSVGGICILRYLLFAKSRK